MTDTEGLEHNIFWRCAYRWPDWTASSCGRPDGFARTYWMSQEENAESMARATEDRGGEAFIEERRVSHD